MGTEESSVEKQAIKRPPVDVLKRVVDDALKNGYAFRSLRAIAETSGISHRMLIYHFGSQHGVWSAIINEVREAERTLFAAETEQVNTPDELKEFLQVFGRRYTSGDFLPFYQLHFETYSYALRHREECSEFLEGVVHPWVTALTALFVKVGFNEDDAHQRARIILASTRGYFLDLITTGEADKVDRSALTLLDLVCAKPAKSA
ncbi:TPA: TetR/AcrR family transcriptional regulator [Pseudomonas aeruginosa]|nr:TetR/AcrR family transcriptional regulator [Pseudomonas aeruginosa]HCE9552468.1 TetR/AcrR family transcriptional regulator [Pseudomonas aeruginosa]